MGGSQLQQGFLLGIGHAHYLQLLVAIVMAQMVVALYLVKYGWWRFKLHLTRLYRVFFLVRRLDVAFLEKTDLTRSLLGHLVRSLAQFAFLLCLVPLEKGHF